MFRLIPLCYRIVVEELRHAATSDAFDLDVCDAREETLLRMRFGGLHDFGSVPLVWKLFQLDVCHLE